MLHLDYQTANDSLFGGLVSSDGTPVMIDYGDVDVGPRSLDPISFEFSLLFFPEGPLVNESWPSDAQARRWFDLDAYLQDCPVPEFVRAVRQWAVESAAGQRELAATAYAYRAELKRQLDLGLRQAHLEAALQHLAQLCGALPTSMSAEGD